CKQRCTIASCPGGACECAGGDTCVTSILASPDLGVCGRLAGYEEACDEDADLYCAPAPGEATAGNAFSVCVDRCRYVCRYNDVNGTPVELACPSGMDCRADPTGRLLDTVQVCVDVP